MMRLTVALLLLAGVEVAGFSYDRCNAAEGPGNWSGVCKTNSQGTPIDLCGAVAFTAPTLNLTGYTAGLTMNIINNGHTIQCATTSTPVPEFTAGMLSTMVGRGTNTAPQTWAFAQIHFHWGRTGLTNEGSEHFIQGVRYPIEGHLVHYNKKYGNISAAVASGANDALAVVGVMFELGSSDVPFMVAAADAVATATQTPRVYSTSAMLSDLWNGVGDFYSYGGGLTTPGCVEIVTWIVMKTPKPITLATLNKFKAASEDPSSSSADLIAKYGNYRPILPHNGRTVYSSNGATAACTNASEPVFTCNNAGVSGSSVAAPWLALHLVVGLALASLSF